MHNRSLFVSGIIAVIGAVILVGGIGLMFTDVGSGSHSEGVDANTVTSGDGPTYVTTTYPVSDQSPRVHVNITIAPEDESITNMTLEIQSSHQSHVDFDSFGIARIDPSGAAEPQETLERVDNNIKKIYEISSLSPGERVEITFEAYPTELQTADQRIDVAEIDYEFRRGGILQPDNPPASISAETDISNSPVELLAEHDDDEEDDRSILPMVGLVVGIAGIGIGVGGVVLAKNNSGGSSSVSRRTIKKHARSVDDLKTQAQVSGKQELANKAEEIYEEMQEDIDKLR